MSTESKKRAWNRRRDNPDTRGQLLRAAATAFARDGYEGTSLAAIARVVGVTAPSVYNHFKSKNALLFTFLDEYGSLVLDRCLKAIDSAASDPKAQLEAFVKAHVRTDLEHADVVPLVNLYFQHGTGAERALTPEQRTYFTKQYRTLVDRLRGIIADGVAADTFQADNLNTATFSVLGSVSNAVYWFRSGGALDIEVVAAQLADHATRSLSPR